MELAELDNIGRGIAEDICSTPGESKAHVSRREAIRLQVCRNNVESPLGDDGVEKCLSSYRPSPPR
jgi:hypothetical protein